MRLSNPIEALIASMIASGPAAKRPPHIWFEDLSDMVLPLRRENEEYTRRHPLYGPRCACKPGTGRSVQSRSDARKRYEKADLPQRSATCWNCGVYHLRRCAFVVGSIQRQMGAFELLGHMVRAMPQGNAHAFRATNRIWRRDL